MIDPKMIPDEVVEAAARVLHAHAEVFHDVLWDDLGDYDQEAYREEARAAIAAGLAKWPKSRRDMLEHWDAWDDEEDCDDTWSEDVLILPLPQEVSDGE